MTRRLLVSVAAAALGLIGAAPASASHPYHVNFKNFPLDAADSTRDGTVLSGSVDPSVLTGETPISRSVALICESFI